jgi:hypothetical protein
MKQPAMAELVPSFDPPEQWRTPEQKAELKAPDWAELRDRIKARDNHTCRFCEHRNDYWMTVDHVDGDPTNNSETNLQTLCYWCHMVKHSGLWCVVNGVVDLYEKPSKLSQVDVIRRTRELRGEGLDDQAILERLGLTEKVPFKQDHGYLATKVAFITMRSFVRDDGRTMFPGRVGVRVGGGYLRAIEDPPPSRGSSPARPQGQHRS